MIQKAITIALLYLKITFSQRSVFLFSFAMPLLFTFVLSQAFRGPGETPQSWRLIVAAEDSGLYARALPDRLEADPIVELVEMDRQPALDAVEEQDALAVLVIPAEFSQALAAGQATELTFYRSGDAIARAQILEQAVGAAYSQINGSLLAAELAVRVSEGLGLFEAEGAPAVEAVFEAAFLAAESAWQRGAAVGVQTRQATRIEAAVDVIPSGASQSSPGMLVMYALFFTFGGGVSLLVERDEGTLRRLLVMPMPKGVVMGGKLLGIFLGAVVQMGIMILAGQWIFGVEWGRSPQALALMLLSYGFAGTALGLLVASLAKTVAQANALGIIVVLALASFGGAWWPIEVVPVWMQQAARALPTYWAMSGFHDIISRGLALQAILFEVAILIGFGLLFLSVGIWRFRFES